MSEGTAEQPPRPPRRFDIVIISPGVLQKINEKHHVTELEIEEAIDHRHGPGRWAANEHGVERVLLKGDTDAGRELGLVLYPADEPGVWRLATAIPVQ